jgi:SNF2 family DNA or RNA helicase
MITNGTQIGNDARRILMNSTCRIIALSATPVINNGYEYAVLFNILNPGSFNMSKDEFTSEFYKTGTSELINRKKFYTKMLGVVSYYQGANENSEVFPSVTVHNEELVMHPQQAQEYIKVANRESFMTSRKDRVSKDDFITSFSSNNKELNAFKMGTRKASTLAISEENTEDTTIDIEKYSVKVARILEHIKNSPGPVMIYSFFVEHVLKYIESILKARNINYVKWVGGQEERERIEILKKFNSPDNTHGEAIKVILISRAGAEGISLKNVRQVHLIEPHWNETLIKQILGRAVRICSHSFLPKDEQRVDIYRYHSRIPEDLITADIAKMDYSIDNFVFGIAQKKKLYDESIENLVKQSAFDCKLNAAQNTDVIDGCIEYLSFK